MEIKNVIVANSLQLQENSAIILLDIPENPKIFENQTKLLQISQNKEDYESGFVDVFGNFISENRIKSYRNRDFSVNNQPLSKEKIILCSAFQCQRFCILGVRHHSIWNLISRFSHLDNIGHSDVIQGFVTGTGEFLTRIEAKNLITETGQKMRDGVIVLEKLFSENLY